MVRPLVNDKRARRADPPRAGVDARSAWLVYGTNDRYRRGDVQMIPSAA
jgi:hypothetical protein